MNISVFKSERFIIAVDTPAGRFKLFQILCGHDGTIYVPFPYYKHSSAQLSEETVEGGRKFPSDLSVSGPLTMHRIKYTHHVDGEAHFSQDGKILTKIRRRANTLPSHSGHIFSVQLQGLGDFQKVTESDLAKKDRVVICMRLESEPASLKMVAHVYSATAASQRLSSPVDCGPWIRVVRDQRPFAAAILAVGDSTDPTGRLLTLSFEEVSSVFPNQTSGFSFIGGFDEPGRAFDHAQDTSFLVLISPVANLPEATQRFGTVDLPHADS